MKKDNIEINEHFEQTLDLLENSTKNIFITGRAGTGKSTLLTYFRSITAKKIVVLAPTGVAAVNIAGQTIHSFFRFKPSTTLSGVRKLRSKDKNRLYRQIDMIIIDEISMVRPDLLDCIDKFMRLNGNDSSLPFGGVQMVFIGDLYQLPPVFVRNERELFADSYKGKYFFDSGVFQTAGFCLEFIELEKIYRQTDEKFIELLNSIRNGSVADDGLTFLNKRVRHGKELEQAQGVYLTTTNKMAFEINSKKLNELSGTIYSFSAHKEGNFKDEYMPADYELRLKKKSQVMLLNNDPLGRWVNGTIAQVSKIEKDKDEQEIIYVKLPDGSVEDVSKCSWEIFQYKMNQKNDCLETETIGSFTQYPLKLAWAVTVHKSQGKTFDNVILDISGGVFAAGQMYVALSRCRTFEGITLKQPLHKKHIIVDWKIRKFLTKLQYNLSDKLLPLEEKIKLIEQAIKENKEIEIIYLKAMDEKTRRIIRPVKIGLMEYEGREFMGLSAHCLSRGQLRTFNVERILEVEVKD